MKSEFDPAHYYMLESKPKYSRKLIPEKVKGFALGIVAASVLAAPFGLKCVMEYSPSVKEYVMGVLDPEKK